MKICGIGICFFLMFTILSGCVTFLIYSSRTSHRDGKYNGDYPELYSIAVNSVLGTRGYHPDSHGRFQSMVEIREEDSFGRVMFFYYEKNTISRLSLIISQKSDEEYAYYYPDYNFISIPGGKFSDEKIEEMKRKNDWNMNIDIDRYEKVKIIRQKAEKGPVKKSQVKEFHRKVLGNDASGNHFTIFFTKDDYNRSMYVGFGRRRKDLSERYDILFFQPDGSYDDKNGVMELTDLNNYQDDLMAFKERNNWNIKP